MAVPSQVEVERIQVFEGYHLSEYNQDDLNDDIWGLIVREYNRNATGPMKVYLSHPQVVLGKAGQPASVDRKAASLASEYRRILTEMGVDEVSVDTVAVADRAIAGRVVVSYKEMQAREPENCARLSGLFGAESIHEGKNYQMGCENMRYVSRMVSDPTDLLGKSSTWDADASRAGNIVEQYRTGEPFDNLDVTNASDVDG